MKARLQRAQDLRLVVDDEDARLSRERRPSAAAGSARTNVAPVPGSACSSQTRPPLAWANPRAIASPRPLPGRPVARRARTARRSSPARRRDSRSVIRTRTSSSSPSADAASSTSVGDEYLSAFSSKLTSTRSMWAPSTWVGGRSAASDTETRSASAPTCSSAFATQRVDRPQLRPATGGPASSRERSSRFSTSRSSRLASLRIVSDSRSRQRR